MNIQDIIVKNIGRIYLFLPYLKTLKIGEKINSMVQDQGNVDIGRVAEILILNRACGFATPLYQLSEWAEKHCIGEVYGCLPSKLNDDRVGEVLDKLHSKLSDLDSLITLGMIENYDIDISQVHFDASSFKVTGNQISHSDDPKTIDVTYGRSSNDITYRRQVRCGITISNDGAIPLTGSAYSGNASDYEMHPEALENLRSIGKTSNFLFVADSKFDSIKNLKNVFEHKGKFLCPGSFSVKLKKEFLSLQRQNKILWENISYISKTDKKKPKSKREYYKSFETIKTLKTKENRSLTEYPYRFIYIYSSSNAKQDKKTREKYFNRIYNELEKIIPRLNRDKYRDKKYIKEKINSILNMKKSIGRLFSTKLRCSNGKFSFEFSYNKNEIKRLEQLDGIYILKTNLDEQYCVDDIFSIYKQQGQIEYRIKNIKSMMKVAPVFLKLPKRIKSMFFIIMQALKLFSLVEYELRNALKEKKISIPILPEGRNTCSPSGETILKAFDDVYIIKFSKNNKRFLLQLSEIQRVILRLLFIPLMDLRNLSRRFGKLRNRSQFK